MRLVDNVMRGDFLKNGFGEIGFVYKIDENIHIQLLEGPDVGQTSYNLISPVQLTENFLKKNLLFDEETDTYREYFYEDEDKDGFGIYVRAYNDGTFYAEAAIEIGSFSKDIQFVHELQHMFKEFNIKKDWIL